MFPVKSSVAAYLCVVSSTRGDDQLPAGVIHGDPICVSGHGSEVGRQSGPCSGHGARWQLQVSGNPI